MLREGSFLQFIASAVVTMVLVGAAWGYTQSSVNGHGLQINELKAVNHELRLEINELKDVKADLATIKSDVSWIREDITDLKRWVRTDGAVE